VLVCAVPSVVRRRGSHASPTSSGCPTGRRPDKIVRACCSRGGQFVQARACALSTERAALSPARELAAP
jgi:hypothetical protein